MTDKQENKRSIYIAVQKVCLCTMTVLFTVDCFSQIQTPQTPTFQQFQPTQPNQSYSPHQNQYQQPNNNQPFHKVQNANDIMEQTDRAAEQRMGTYMDRPHLTPEQNQQARIRYQQQQMAKQPGYYTPSAENNFRQTPPVLSTEQEVRALLYEDQLNRTFLSEQDYKQSSRYLNDLPNYRQAKQHIQDMLNGKKPLSVKDAYFFAEYAFGSLHLSYQQYNEIIEQNARFIRQWLIENGYNPKDPEALHLGIQKFMSDTLWIKGTNIPDQPGVGLPTGHSPYYYDYIDYEAKEDHRNYFITKTLATGTGQCHTLPVTYLILAEALGVEAFLSISPRHSFIQYQNNKGMTVNYETTTDNFPTDQFYLETLPTMAKAKQNKLILASLNREQVVASVLIDMANSFIYEHRLANEKFISECLDIAAGQFPNQAYINTTYFSLRKNLKAKELNDLAQEKGIKNANEFEQYPEVLAAYQDFRNFVNEANSQGYQGFPEGTYMQIIEYQDFKGRLQQARKINTKSVKNLFIH